eukprot:TRINITY_DN15658_c0_g1_i1.p1 TRINITY_DN15658_c0_g1~~TRINITY_DN15658_c0_g1_i1.p1  ORF type:complete len:354 (-),score=74.41 TRINITY_DN15658_c0_g1_i1:197-1258(-)
MERDGERKKRREDGTEADKTQEEEVNNSVSGSSGGGSRSNLLTSLSEPALDRLSESEKIVTANTPYHGSLKVGTTTGATNNTNASSSIVGSSQQQQQHASRGQGVLSSSVNSIVGLRGKERKLRVSYCFRPGDEGLKKINKRHCFGINSLALSYDVPPTIMVDDEDESNDETHEHTHSPNSTPCYLFSAGRDSTVRCWDVSSINTKGSSNPNTAIPHVRSYEHHTDWVNDLFVTKDGRNMVTCSSDSTIKVWDIASKRRNRKNDGEQGQKKKKKQDVVVATLNNHTDYVKALAYSPHQNCFASAGFDCDIYIWDLERCCVKSKHSSSSSDDANNVVFESDQNAVHHPIDNISM